MPANNYLWHNWIFIHRRVQHTTTTGNVALVQTSWSKNSNNKNDKNCWTNNARNRYKEKPKSNILFIWMQSKLCSTRPKLIRYESDGAREKFLACKRSDARYWFMLLADHFARRATNMFVGLLRLHRVRLNEICPAKHASVRCHGSGPWACLGQHRET